MVDNPTVPGWLAPPRKPGGLRGLRLPRFGSKRTRSPARLLGNRARDAHDWVLAIRYYREVLDLEPNDAPIWVQYGHALKESGNVAAAEEAYRRSIALRPEVADTHLQLGHALKLQGRRDEAAAAYLHALAVDPQLRHAAVELVGLGWTMAGIDRWTMARLQRVRPKEAPEAERRDKLIETLPSVVFDVTELIGFFSWARLPNGIPRLQIQVGSSLLRGPRRDYDVTLAYMPHHGDFWVEVPQELFLEIADLALAGGDLDDPEWRGALGELTVTLAAAEPLRFRRGATLLNLATTDWSTNFFLLLRVAKARYDIRFVTFVHDCTPLVVPECFKQSMICEYVQWLVGVLYHADGYLVHSQATAADLAKAAALVGRPGPAPGIINHDAHFASNGEDNDPESRRAGDAIVKRHGLQRRPFILFVATIEPRKNHLLTFNVWLAMIRKRGLRDTPMLVCVGQPGWLSDAAMARMNSSELLQQKVLILSNVSDPELAGLYRHCLFTLYPSSYEGWGRPVTESLCYGKVPVTTMVSSLPEAGGSFAEYFDLQSERDLLEKLERLIDDGAYREAREADIKQHFRPRSWGDIAEQIVECALVQRNPPAAAPRLGNGEDIWPLPASSGRYYTFSRSQETTIWSGIVAGEMYRMGQGWWSPDEWGSWMKREAAEIAFSLGEAQGARCVVFLHLRGTPRNLAEYHVEVVGQAAEESGTIAAGEDRWVMLAIEPASGGVVHIRVLSKGKCNLAEATNGSDRRIVTLGIRGFFVCREDDLSARCRLIEAVQLRRLDRLSGRPDGGSRWLNVPEPANQLLPG